MSPRYSHDCYVQKKSRKFRIPDGSTHRQFRKSRRFYSNRSAFQLGLHLLPNLQLTREPRLATVVAAKLDDGARGLLVVEPNAGSFLPLQHGKVEARPDAVNNIGTAPGPGVLDENEAASGIAVVDFELYVAEGESSERSTIRCFSGVERAFDEFRLKSNR